MRPRRVAYKRSHADLTSDDFFPPAADLPEGIPDAKLQSHYGGLSGQRYRRLIEETKRRIAGCAAYR